MLSSRTPQRLKHVVHRSPVDIARSIHREADDGLLVAVPLSAALAYLVSQAESYGLLLVLAFLNRHGPGMVCGGTKCEQQFSPWPWLIAGVLFVLLGAFPLLLIATAVPGSAWLAGPAGWGLAWWGIGMYWVAAALYVGQAATATRQPA